MNIVSFQLGPDLNIVGSHHDGHSSLIVACARKRPQPVIDGIADEQADSQRQASNHQQTTSVHSSPSGTTPDLFVVAANQFDEKLFVRRSRPQRH